LVFLIHTELRCTVNHTSDLQDRQFRYDVTFRQVHATVVAVEEL